MIDRLKQSVFWLRQISIVLMGWFSILSVSLIYAQEPGDLIWKSTAGWKVRDVSSAGDVNNDGIADVFVASGNDMVICFSGGGINKGEILWTWPIPNDVWSVTNISDVNHDGVEDCLAGGGDNHVYCLSGKPENGSTHEIWRQPVLGDVWTVARIGDLDNDGINDCLAGSGDDHVYCFSGSSGLLLWSYTDAADILTVHAIPDVNGDGKEDCLAGGHGNRVLCISGGSSVTGELLWHYTLYAPVGASVLSVSPIEDVDGDGIADCLAGGLNEAVYCISGGSSDQADLIWIYPTGANVLSVASISDVNEDGFPDGLAGGLDDKVFCVSGHSGTLIWTYSATATVFDVDAILDVNGDGIEDCIAGGGDNKIHCIDGKLGDCLWFSSTVGSVLKVAAVSDLNGNGASDVIGGSDDSYVYVFEGGESVIETVDVPTVPVGPDVGKVGANLAFTTENATSNLGHSLEYHFDWGDNTISDWGTVSQSHLYNNVGSYSIKVQARCQIHKSVVSNWSADHDVSISGHQLNISFVGSGNVTKNPDKDEYNHNEGVVLNPIPSAGYQFDHWEGDLLGNTYPETLVMNGNKSVIVHFTQTSEIISTPNEPEGVSQGNVGEVLAFITGGAKSNLDHPVEYRFDWGDGSYSEWGDSVQTDNWTQIGLYTVKAQARCENHPGVISNWSAGHDVSISGHQLNISIVGYGSVTKNPDKDAYNHNENVALTPVPSADYQFDHWEGDLLGNTYPETLVMNADKSITAHFSQIPEVISTPTTLQGSSTGNVGEMLIFITGGAKSSLNHTIEYRFDWGDGSFSDWGDSVQANSWNQIGAYTVKTQARCSNHTSVESDWSQGMTVQIGTTGVESIKTDQIPTKFYLTQNYPNPFNSTTAIEFHIPRICRLQIQLFNIYGEEIRVLAEGYYSPGIYRVIWDGKNTSGVTVSSGIYTYRLITDQLITSRTLLLLK